MTRSKKRLLSAALAAACVLSTSRGRAVEPPAQLPTLGDEESLVRYALAHNPELGAAAWDRTISAAKVSEASALSNPVARGEWLHVQSPADYGFGIGLEWSPPQPGVYGARTAAARAEARATREDLKERAADLECQVRGVHAQIIALEQELALAEESLATRRKIHEAVKERTARGAATRIDLSLTAVSLARGEQEHDLLSLKRASALSELEALLGLPPGEALAELPRPAPTLIELGVSAPAADDRSSSSADAELSRTADGARPQIRADRARIEAAEQVLAAERAKRYPWFELQVRYRRHDQSNYPNDLTFGVAITLPILSQNSGPIAAAEATRQKQGALAAARRLGIEREVRVLRAESLRRARIAAHYAAEIAPILQEHAALVKQALSGLELDLTAVLNAEDMVARGGIEYVEARLAQREAEISLQRALGNYGKAARARLE
jgi:outer membrane protein TolC